MQVHSSEVLLVGGAVGKQGILLKYSWKHINIEIKTKSNALSWNQNRNLETWKAF